MKTDLFQSCGHCWVFQICWHIECSTFTASSFRIWNSSTGIPSPPLALFVVMLPTGLTCTHCYIYFSFLFFFFFLWSNLPDWVCLQMVPRIKVVMLNLDVVWISDLVSTPVLFSVSVSPVTPISLVGKPRLALISLLSEGLILSPCLCSQCSSLLISLHITCSGPCPAVSPVPSSCPVRTSLFAWTTTCCLLTSVWYHVPPVFFTSL